MRILRIKMTVCLLALFILFGGFSTAFAASSFKFAVIADPHMSVAGQKSPKNGSKMFKESVQLLEATIKEINQTEGIDFVVALGDLTKDAEPWNVDRFKEVMDDLTAPYYVVLGNHDISPVDTNKAARSPGVTRATMIWTFQGHGYNGPKTHWSFDPLPNIHLIGLDSTRTGDWDGRITQEGLNFLERDLASNPNKLTIVLLHHQLTAYCNSAVSGENDFDKFVTRNAGDVLEVLRKHPQVVMTMSGHRHISTRYKKDNHIALFTCPSTMTWPMRYCVFEVDNEKISYNTYDVPCNLSILAEAKENMMNDKWWHPKDEHPSTPEGNKKFEEFMLSSDTMSGEVKFATETKNIIAGRTGSEFYARSASVALQN